MPLSRRRFIAASVAAAYAWHRPLLANDASEFTLRFASPYPNEEADTSPHMHAEIKSLVEQASKGRIRVEILDSGKAGIGPDLMAKVSRGLVDGAIISASNLSPIAPALDVLNIPFWSADNQAYENLVNSAVWQDLVVDRVHAAGAIHIWFPYVVGPRTLATGHHKAEAILTPEHLVNSLVRVPSSDLLRHFYTLVGARTRRVPWGDVAQSLRQQQVDVIDPSISSLYSGPDHLRQHIAHITHIQSVHDGWMAVLSQQWLAALPNDLKSVMTTVAEEIHRLQPKAARQAHLTAEQRFKKMGVGSHYLDEVLKKRWRNQYGHQHPSWRRYKRNILGDEGLFDQLLKAAEG